MHFLHSDGVLGVVGSRPGSAKKHEEQRPASGAGGSASGRPGSTSRPASGRPATEETEETRPQTEEIYVPADGM